MKIKAKLTSIILAVCITSIATANGNLIFDFESGFDDIGSNVVLPMKNLHASGQIYINDESNVVISGLRISNPNGSCVEIRNGSSNIIIENSEIGPCGGKGIDAANSESVTIRNNFIHDTEHEGIYTYKVSSIEITNNRIDRVRTGVYAVSSTGVDVNYNTVRNVQGPFPRGQIVQFAWVKGAGNRVAYNRGINEMGKSQPEDIINMYKSKGVPGDEIMINNNVVTGGFSESGGGILLGDNGGSYQIAQDNIVVNTGGHGMSIAGGHHNKLINNKIYGRKSDVSNVGLYVWDVKNNSNCSNNTVRGNLVNWTNKDGIDNGSWDGGNCGSIDGWSDNDWKAPIGEDIAGQLPLNWNWIPLTEARWSIVMEGGSNALFLNTSSYGSLSGNRLGEHITSPDNYTDFSFSVKAKSKETAANNANADYALVFGFVDGENYYYMLFNRTMSNTELFKVVNGSREVLAAATTAWLTDTEYHDIEVRRVGNSIEVRFDNNIVVQAEDATFPTGRLGLGSFNDSAYFDDIRITGANNTDNLIFKSGFEVVRAGSNVVLPMKNLQASGQIYINDESNVVISGLRISNPNGSCVEIRNGSSNIIIENSEIGPCDGKGIDAANSESVTIRNNYIHDTEHVGIYTYKVSSIEITNNRIDRVRTGVYATSSTGVDVNYNTVRNVQGPFPRGQIVQFAYVKGAGNRVAYNRGINEMGKSQPEDIINMYKSNGVPGDEIMINNNVVIGGFSASGGGILLGDNGGSYQIAQDNIVVNTGAHGMSIAGGHHNKLINNKIYGRKSDITNVGLYVWDVHNNSNCSNNTVRGNLVNWTNKDGIDNGSWDGGNCGSIDGWFDNDWKAPIGEDIAVTCPFC